MPKKFSATRSRITFLYKLRPKLREEQNYNPAVNSSNTQPPPAHLGRLVRLSAEVRVAPAGGHALGEAEVAQLEGDFFARVPRHFDSSPLKHLHVVALLQRPQHLRRRVAACRGQRLGAARLVSRLRASARQFAQRTAVPDEPDQIGWR